MSLKWLLLIGISAQVHMYVDTPRAVTYCSKSGFSSSGPYDSVISSTSIAKC